MTIRAKFGDAVLSKGDTGGNNEMLAKGLAHIDLPGGMQVFLLYLLEDGLLIDGGMAPWATQIQGVNTHDRYFLTEKGRAFVDRWMSAEPLV